MNDPYEYRRLLPTEHHACYVGSGECFVPAAYVTDNGCGQEVYMCPLHREEMEMWQKKFEKLSPHLFEQLEAHVEAELKKQTDDPNRKF